MEELIFSSKQHPFKFWESLDKSITTQPPRTRTEINFYPSEASALVRDEDDNDLVLGGCLRKSWFRGMLQRFIATGQSPDLNVELVGEEFTATAMWKFAISKYTEIAIIDESKRAKLFESNNVKFKWNLPFSFEKVPPVISGELDLAVYLNSEDERSGQLALIDGEGNIVVPVGSEQPTPDTTAIGVEIKSISGYKGPRQVFGVKSKRTGSWITKPEPKEDNLLQSVLYTMYFCVLNKKYAYWKLAYINRENGMRTEFDIDLVPEEVDPVNNPGQVLHRVYVDRKPYKYVLYGEHILARYKDLHGHLESMTLPPRDYDLQYSHDQIKAIEKKGKLSKTEQAFFDKGKLDKIIKGDWQCSYCPFKSLCYGTDKKPTDIKVLSTEDIIKAAQNATIHEEDEEEISE